ncbi:hypothetical protein FOPG_02960 [Fusarium oxysporum f. sp. conglutinans race 2 54008]|uniref:Uncharacterized protein n=2 Tax=Fusarium oxysporum TaxID=5507 RepID=X0MI08_FUSOX|nr:hypothetical protein FOPG_02960 [Fusarium oxysporum f. sp. conglutinans race 2 54008]EXM33036.1 hypothetical protein FOTG_03156 [Fusarium oxysporum f. sp. vasinfectum 25433]KAI8403135.1 hypothetical protein FOFC_16569 [Fusarium oxysporum]KAK2700435.1 hypothetical protein QWA68_001291 [Fusarium oxysporum]
MPQCGHLQVHYHNDHADQVQPKVRKGQKFLAEPRQVTTRPILSEKGVICAAGIVCVTGRTGSSWFRPCHHPSLQLVQQHPPAHLIGHLHQQQLLAEQMENGRYVGGNDESLMLMQMQ